MISLIMTSRKGNEIHLNQSHLVKFENENKSKCCQINMQLFKVILNDTLLTVVVGQFLQTYSLHTLVATIAAYSNRLSTHICVLCTESNRIESIRIALCICIMQ